MSIGHILFGFEGRLNRARWWGSNLLAPTPTGIVVFTPVAYLPFLWIFAALGVKGLHDRNRSGLLLLMFFGVPVLLSLVTLSLTSGVQGLLLGLGSSPSSASTAALGSRAVLLLLLQGLSLAVSAWALVELGCLDGTPGWNRYGPDPAAKTYAAHG